MFYTLAIFIPVHEPRSRMALTPSASSAAGSTRTASESRTSQLLAQLAVLRAMAIALVAQVLGEGWHEVDASRGPVYRAAQTGVVQTVIVIAVIAIVGILIVSEIETAVNISSESTLSGSITNLLGQFSNVMTLVGVAMLVLVAAVVLRAIMTRI